jgi:hypothetical protein
VHGVDEVECRVPSGQLELVLPDLSHSESVSPSKAV